MFWIPRALIGLGCKLVLALAKKADAPPVATTRPAENEIGLHEILATPAPVLGFRPRNNVPPDVLGE